MSLNKVMIIGRLGKDPEMRYLENNVAVARFSVATSEFYKDSAGNRIEKTEWINVVIWRQLAEIAGKFLKKGSQVYLEGKLTTRSYDDPKTNEKRYVTEVVATDMKLLDKKSDGDGQSNTGSSNQYQSGQGSPRVSEPRSGAMENIDDDLPF